MYFVYMDLIDFSIWWLLEIVLDVKVAMFSMFKLPVLQLLHVCMCARIFTYTVLTSFSSFLVNWRLLFFLFIFSSNNENFMLGFCVLLDHFSVYLWYIKVRDLPHTLQVWYSHTCKRKDIYIPFPTYASFVLSWWVVQISYIRNFLGRDLI